jgi:ricin-type beta-trefoil lectin protein
MLKRTVRNLAVTGITIVLAIMLTAVGAIGASAAAIAAARPGHAGVAGTTVAPAAHVNALAHVATPASAATTGIPPVNSTVPFTIKNYLAPHRCVGISGGAIEKPAVLWNCNGAENQSWHWGSVVGGYVTDPYGNVLPAINLISGDHNQCLGIAGNSTTPGAHAYGWPCNGKANQYWALDIYLLCPSNGVAYTPLFNLNTNRTRQVLGVADNSNANGAALVQFPYQGKCNNQFWA